MKQAVFPFEHKSRKYGLGYAVLIGLVASATAQSVSARFPITSAQITVAMQNRQLPTEELQVKISTPITASIAEPMLEIQTIALLNAHTAQIRMACRNHTECLPFYASVSWPEESAMPTVPLSIRQAVNSVSTQTTHAQPSVKASLYKPEGVKREEPQTLHAGAAAMLAMDQNRVHVLVRVVCLEGGITGDKVRVTTPDHKQAYVAEIVSPTLLKGSF